MCLSPSQELRDGDLLLAKLEHPSTQMVHQVRGISGGWVKEKGQVKEAGEEDGTGDKIGWVEEMERTGERDRWIKEKGG